LSIGSRSMRSKHRFPSPIRGFRNTLHSIYYQHNVTRISTCPVTIHALLHLADSIKFMGPAWCYWAFPMERYCGTLNPAIRSRRFPYASLDRFVTEYAQLTQIKVAYNLLQELSLKPLHGSLPGIFSDPRCKSFSQGSYVTVSHWQHPYEDPTCVLLPPRDPSVVPATLQVGIAAALATRFDKPINIIKEVLKVSLIDQWGKVRRTDSEAGDTMSASSLMTIRDDLRDATYVRVPEFSFLLIIY